MRNTASASSARGRAKGRTAVRENVERATNGVRTDTPGTIPEIADRKEMMDKFDALPPILRDAINNSLFPRGVGDVWSYLEKGYGAEFIARTIEVQDKMKEAQSYV